MSNATDPTTRAAAVAIEEASYYARELRAALNKLAAFGPEVLAAAVATDVDARSNAPYLSADLLALVDTAELIGETL